MKLNAQFDALTPSYLFADIGSKIRAFSAEHPDADLIKMGIGDVTLPLAPVVCEAMEKAAAAMGTRAGFHGYGPDETGYGYVFLIDPIRDYYAAKGVTLAREEVFIGDGAKSDLGNLMDLLSADNTVLIPDPVYPAYLDANVIAGHRVLFADATAENGFLPLPDPTVAADVIYICSPNNPTGAVYDRAGLKAWVDYANTRGALIVYDAAYEAFVTDAALPTSIFQIDGARTCAIEICSLSKKAGFTGTRCGYTVIPTDLVFGGKSFNRLWLRRMSTKFNGVSYVTQCGAAAVFTPQGETETRRAIDYYRANAAVIGEALDALGIWYCGGKNSPYVWFKCPCDSSWEFFDRLLNKANVVGTPGAGFGRNGEGFMRLTAFGDADRTREAMARFKTAL